MSAKIYTLTCKCGEETVSGSNEAAVRAAMARHEKKKHPKAVKK